MKDKFLIGEISKLFNVPSKTLRYYDEIDLFKPVEINKNGYRLYSTDQFEQLNTINYLKTLGMPLKVIKSHLEKRNIDYIQSLLEEQKVVIELKIKELNKMKSNLTNRLNHIKEAKQYKDINIITEKLYSERKVCILRKEVKTVSELELYIRELENKYKKNSTIFIGKVGVTLSMKKLMNNDFKHHDSIFLIPDINDEFYEKVDSSFESGKYICINFIGSHSSSSIYYKKLINYINENSYEICGDSFERTLIDFALTKNLNEYLTEIQIPVKDK